MTLFLFSFQGSFTDRCVTELLPGHSYDINTTSVHTDYTLSLYVPSPIHNISKLACSLQLPITNRSEISIDSALELGVRHRILISPSGTWKSGLKRNQLWSELIYGEHHGPSRSRVWLIVTLSIVYLQASCSQSN